MKIAYVITKGFPIGGAQIHVRDLGTFLRDLGHSVAVIAGGMNGEESGFARSLRDRDIPYFHVPSLDNPISTVRDFRALREVRAILKVMRPDIVSTHSSKAGLLGRLAAASLQMPVVFTAHGWAFAEGVSRSRAMFYRNVEKLAASITDRIIAVSQADADLALRHHVVPPGKLITIHNGMPDLPDSFRSEPARTPVRLVMIARFQEQKDHSTLLRALGELVEEDWTLDLIGEGPLMPETRELAIKLGMASRIRFLGERLDVPRLLSAAQIYLLISNWEGFPRSILEAMRAGLPVIASDVGGCREAVVEGKTGYLVPRGSVEVLAGRLKTLLTSAELRVQMGKAGRERFERHFIFESMAQRTLQVYESVLRESILKGPRRKRSMLDPESRIRPLQRSKRAQTGAEAE